MRPRSSSLISSIAVVVAVLASPGAAAAHTDADLVAVAAGDQATLNLQPTHGCDGSPTVEVAIQAPLTGATAGEVEGWTATTTEDDAGNTVLEWTGGTLPADAEGTFPVQFTVPDEVGELLVFPAVQVCENGEELAWIDGDPDGEYPAPRILVLPAGTEAAESIDDVPADAPGRDQLVAIVDVDNPGADPVSETTSTTGSGEGSSTTTEPTEDDAAELEETDTPVVGDTETESEPADQDDDRALAMVVALVLVAAVGGTAAFVLKRRRSAP